MCSYQTLFHDYKSGFVIRCEACENIQITFGNFIVNLIKSDFNQFIATVKKVRTQQHPSADIAVKSIIIPTPCLWGKAFIQLSRGLSLRELESMLEAADTELQSLELIELFKEDKI
jgi:hypothetical protein